ncbi:hypothetical protein [Humibacillus xanthopallidus]|uniref:hypothetical protein n=1 Tax=Humibacillus xanthopallidus TaxID=412689 RepID=UPI00384A9B01
MDVAKLAVAAIGVVSVSAALVGGFTGAIARVARNGPWWLPAIVFLVFLAAAMALKPTVTDCTAKVRGRLLIGALSTFGLASVVVALALSQSLAKPDRPVIDVVWAKTDGGWSLKGTVRASGLQTGDKLTVQVNRIVTSTNEAPPTTLVATPGMTTRPAFNPPPHFAYYAGTVYKQVIGADLDGNATLNLQVPLPQDYDGLQVSANLGDAAQCPQDDRRFSESQLACIVLDAPSWSAATVTTPPPTSTMTTTAVPTVGS